MKIRTATITFHSPHNYGSMLQAYALQNTLLNLGYSNEIINLRTERQILLYNRWKSKPVRNLRTLLKRTYMLPYQNAIDKKYQLYEDFLKNELNTTQEFKTLEEIEKANLSYDCYISGGDQIWNTAPDDFDWSFYLPFVKTGKRISYAVSMGPHAETQVTDRDKVKRLLQQYNHISVREEGTANLVQSLVDIPVSIELDPALLFTGEEWGKHVSTDPLIKGDYILLYSPGYKKSVYDLAKYLSKKLKMKVVITLFTLEDRKYNFVRHYATGPWEFLNLTKNAKLVLSGSFHALVFATLFHTPFYAVDGDKDNRMKTFLSNMNLADRTISLSDCEQKLATALLTDFNQADQYLKIKREESITYLKNAVEN